NVAFQCGKYTEAVEHYTAAISKSVKSHSFAAFCFCNRAAAHQSLGEIIDAIGDCSLAIALDRSTLEKGYLREMIGDYKHATDDLQTRLHS
ncbi:DnaJ domain, tetratricopeptide-like helical domain protein, partial [Tanacetum coccineum]